METYTVMHTKPWPEGIEPPEGYTFAAPKWTLTIGIHNGTFTSRDSEQPKTMDSLEACQQMVTAAERDYAKIGYFIWFARCIDPEGKEHSMNYRRMDYNYRSSAEAWASLNGPTYGF